MTYCWRCGACGATAETTDRSDAPRCLSHKFVLRMRRDYRAESVGVDRRGLRETDTERIPAGQGYGRSFR